MSNKREPLTEAEARQIGAWLGRELGDGPGPEVLAEQRLRLAQSRHVPEWRRPRLWAIGGGMLTAAIAVGAVIVVGKWRAGQAFTTAANHPGISAEPLTARERDQEPMAPDTAVVAEWRWRWAKTSDGSTSRPPKADRPVHESLSGKAASVRLGQWLDATSERVVLELSPTEQTSGGRLQLSSGSRAQVIEVDATALKVNLEEGRAEVTVGDQPSKLALQAGPYGVRAAAGASTADYEVSWNAKTAALRVQVTSGEVEVTAPSDVDHHVVRPGKVLSLTASDRVASNKSTNEPARVRAPIAQRIEGPGPAEESRSGETLEARAASPLPSVDDGSGSTASNLDAGRWRKFAENGQYTAAVKEAELVGFGTLEQNASASDLLLLADVARLGGAPQKARGVLLSLRSRYPGHTNSATAAFTLGRMAQEQEHDDRRAMQWYRTYLKEEPRGRMAEGARARLLKAALRVGSAAEREQAARDYLAQHPTGSSAAVARSMLSK